MDGRGEQKREEERRREEESGEKTGVEWSGEKKKK